MRNLPNNHLGSLLYGKKRNISFSRQDAKTRRKFYFFPLRAWRALRLGASMDFFLFSTRIISLRFYKP